MRLSTWLLTLPLLILGVAFTFANRAPVRLSFDPISPDSPLGITAPLFVWLLAALFAMLGRHWWPLELFAHFRLVYLGAALLFALLAVTASWRWALLVLAAGLPHLYVVLEPAWSAQAATASPASTSAAPGRPVRVLSANVFFYNRETERLRVLIARERPDIVVLQEFALHWPATLKGLPPAYRFHVTHRGTDGAIVSRHPIRAKGVLGAGELRFAPVWADIDVGGTLVRVIGVHTALPLDRWGYRNQSRYLDVVAKAARDFGGPVIVAGDFNLTHWTGRFSRFSAAGRLRRVAPTGLLARTWYPPTLGALAPVLALPIDHVLVRGPIRVVDARIGPEIGSDHRPQIVNLRLTGN